MGSIGWDIVRTTLCVFLLILISGTAVVWLAPAVRARALITRRGDTVTAIACASAVIVIRCIVIARRVLVIAPIAMVLAAAHAVDALTTDCGAERLTRRRATM